MTEPYLFEKAIGQQMGDLCRLAVGDAKVTQTGEIVTLEEMTGRGAFGVSVEVPYTSGGVQSVIVTRCGKNLLDASAPFSLVAVGITKNIGIVECSSISSSNSSFFYWRTRYQKGDFVLSYQIGQNQTEARALFSSEIENWTYNAFYYGWYRRYYGTNNLKFRINSPGQLGFVFVGRGGAYGYYNNLQLELGSTATAYEPYNGDTYTITLPADFYGGSIDLEAGTVTSRYAADGTELADPVVTEIDPISIPILAGVNNIWADTGTVAVSYYAADAQAFRPALWYPTIYRGLTSARYLIKRASGAIASFDDAIAAPLVGLRVALPWRSEGYDAVEVTVNGTATTITLPTTVYGGYLDVVTGQLVATHDANGNLLTNQKLYFLPPTNISALAGVNNVWSDAGDVAVSYRIDNG